MPIPLVAMTGLTVMIVPLVVSVLVALGIGVVTYTGMDFAVSEGQSYVLSNYNNMPAAALSIMNMAGVLQGINIFFAAWTASIAIKVTMGVFTKIRVTPQ